MGKNTATAGIDLAQTIVSDMLGALNAKSATPACFLRNFNFTVSGTFVGTVALQCSFDGGTTFVPAFNRQTGAAITFTGPGSIESDQWEAGVFYQAQMTAYTSGSALVRISAGAVDGDMARLS